MEQHVFSMSKAASLDCIALRGLDSGCAIADTRREVALYPVMAMSMANLTRSMSLILVLKRD
jgi:hypothetical protein